MDKGRLAALDEIRLKAQRAATRGIDRFRPQPPETPAETPPPQDEGISEEDLQLLMREG